MIEEPQIIKDSPKSNLSVKILGAGCDFTYYTVGLDAIYNLELKNYAGRTIYIHHVLKPLLEGCTHEVDSELTFDNDGYVVFDGFKNEVEGNVYEWRDHICWANEMALPSSGTYTYIGNMTVCDENKNVLSSFDYNVDVKYKHNVFSKDEVKVVAVSKR